MAKHFDPAKLATDIRESHPPSAPATAVLAPDPIHLAQLETGHRVITCEELAHICNTYGLDPENYFKERE